MKKGFVTKSEYMMKSGFTISELIVVIGIIAIVSGMSLFTFQKLNGKKTAENSAQIVENLLAEARSLAVGSQNSYVDTTSIRVYFKTTGVSMNKVEIRELPSNTLIKSVVLPGKARLDITNCACLHSPDYYLSFEASDSTKLGQIIDLTGSAVFSELVVWAGSAKTNIYIDTLTGNITNTTPTL